MSQILEIKYLLNGTLTVGKPSGWDELDFESKKRYMINAMINADADELMLQARPGHEESVVPQALVEPSLGVEYSIMTPLWKDFMFNSSEAEELLDYTIDEEKEKQMSKDPIDTKKPEEEKEASYDFFVFSSLWNEYNREWYAELEYDYQFPLIKESYKKYIWSDFNDEGMDLVSCIQKYLEDEKIKNSRLKKSDLLKMLELVPHDGYLEIMVRIGNKLLSVKEMSLGAGTYRNTGDEFTELILEGRAD